MNKSIVLGLAGTVFGIAGAFKNSTPISLVALGLTVAAAVCRCKEDEAEAQLAADIIRRAESHEPETVRKLLDEAGLTNVKIES